MLFKVVKQNTQGENQNKCNEDSDNGNYNILILVVFQIMKYHVTIKQKDAQ